MEVPCSTVTKIGTNKLKEDLLEKKPRVVWMTPCTTQRTQQCQSRSRFHRIQVNILVFLWLVEQDWCETTLEQMWSSTSLGRGGVFSEVEHLDVSGVVSLMERSLQNLGTSSVHIDVGQICSVPDDVFMTILIDPWRKKRCSTHRNWSKQS